MRRKKPSYSEYKEHIVAVPTSWIKNWHTFASYWTYIVRFKLNARWTLNLTLYWVVYNRCSQKIDYYWNLFHRNGSFENNWNGCLRRSSARTFIMISFIAYNKLRFVCLNGFQISIQTAWNIEILKHSLIYKMYVIGHEVRKIQNTDWRSRLFFLKI